MFFSRKESDIYFVNKFGFNSNQLESISTLYRLYFLYLPFIFSELTESSFSSNSLQTDVLQKNWIFFSLSLRTESLKFLYSVVVTFLEIRRWESQQLAIGNAYSVVLKKLALDARAVFTRRAAARVIERNVRRVTNVWVIDSMTL